MEFVLAAVLFGFAVAAASLGLRRYYAFHNETFDLALYARMAWGILHGSPWDPVVGAPIVGIHLAFVLIPLALLGEVFGHAETLLVAQACFGMLAAIPLARLAAARLGNAGAAVTAAAWVLYPNLWHVLSGEFHPGTCAALPLAWAVESGLRRAPREFLWSALLAVACREDLALVTFALAFLLRGDARARTEAPAFGHAAGRVMAISAVYFLLFALVLVPVFGPKTGSADLHFGKWGGSLGGIVLSVFTQPAALLAHVFAPERLLYLGKLLAPLAFLPLLAPRVALAALPVLAINLLSEWPTAIALDEHYQTVLLPVLFGAAVLGAERVARSVPAQLVLAAMLLSAAVAHALIGGTPLSRDWDPAPFARDARTEAAERAVAHIPEGRSVQAPYALMPHLAEREFVRKPPPPDMNTDFVILDGRHREAFRGDEDLIRTEEEPVLRDWLAKPSYGLVAREGPFYVLRRGVRTRDTVGGAFLRGRAFPDDATRIAACLGVRSAAVRDGKLVLSLVAKDACPSDLAVRLGCAWDPERVDLLFDGLLSPVLLERGDLLESTHDLSTEERACAFAGRMRIGTLRSSGARPDHEDPISVPLAVAPAATSVSPR
jgi:uncharacterized membrane protein